MNWGHQSQLSYPVNHLIDKVCIVEDNSKIDDPKINEYRSSKDYYFYNLFIKVDEKFMNDYSSCFEGVTSFDHSKFTSDGYYMSQINNLKVEDGYKCFEIKYSNLTFDYENGIFSENK